MSNNMILLIMLIFCYLVINSRYKDNNEYFDANPDGYKVIPQHAKITDPYIKPIIVPNLLSNAEAFDLISETEDNLFTKSGLDSRVYKNNRQHYWIPKKNIFVKGFVQRIADIFDMPFENAENVEVIKYIPYQIYGEHTDGCCDNNDMCKAYIKDGGQRILTVKIYLNDDFVGGELYFPNLNMKYKPNAGDAVAFRSLAQNSNKCHPLGIHISKELTSGIKWIANIYFRENTFRPTENF